MSDDMGQSEAGNPYQPLFGPPVPFPGNKVTPILSDAFILGLATIGLETPTVFWTIPLNVDLSLSPTTTVSVAAGWSGSEPLPLTGFCSPVQAGNNALILLPSDSQSFQFSASKFEASQSIFGPTKQASKQPTLGQPLTIVAEEDGLLTAIFGPGAQTNFSCEISAGGGLLAACNAGSLTTAACAQASCTVPIPKGATVTINFSNPPQGFPPGPTPTLTLNWTPLLNVVLSAPISNLQPNVVYPANTDGFVVATLSAPLDQYVAAQHTCTVQNAIGTQLYTASRLLFWGVVTPWGGAGPPWYGSPIQTIFLPVSRGNQFCVSVSATNGSPILYCSWIPISATPLTAR